MLFFKVNDEGKVIQITTESKGDRTLVSRHNFNTLAAAETIAASATEFDSKLYIAIDNGQWCSPRYDIIQAPAVGDFVSYGFNGDFYPDSKIVKITGKNHRICTTESGTKYWRRKNSGNWVKEGGTWSMVCGYVNERNPCF